MLGPSGANKSTRSGVATFTCTPIAAERGMFECRYASKSVKPTPLSFIGACAASPKAALGNSQGCVVWTAVSDAIGGALVECEEKIMGIVGANIKAVIERS